MKFNDPSMQWTLYYNTTLADFVYAPFRYRSCLAPTHGIFSCTAVVRFSKQTRVTTQKSALMSLCRRLIGCQLGSKLSVGLNLRAWWFMAWHFSKSRTRSQTSKMVGVERGHSSEMGAEDWGIESERERQREKEREGKKERRFKLIKLGFLVATWGSPRGQQLRC